ncbi:transcription antiterminator BglG [Loigolactobacillus backii]|uniref:sigma-54-dependent transcriptional regulator n=1 Tax=Loigolactobacillus backii TaxID=375175 RepID=UPI00094897A8|nr:sigma-54-dependent transcriptional regulator [Loigolactobacillus backii]OLF69857.1 transcription antiterminator BglG [Loigolactobacillus backii]PIO88337.1 transcription antiterminator BglG [Loigolactobacillus backii]
MRRVERIYDYVLDGTKQLTATAIEQGAGPTTKSVAAALEIVRPNVSKALNDLVRSGKLQKLAGRPVRYLPAKFLVQPDAIIRKTADPVTAMPAQPTQVTNTFSVSKTDFFDKMIGANGSLKNQVEQAKAAMLYPPKGLNTLIVGPTGSGKTFFANGMYQFSQIHHIIDKNQPLITFNCADYAHNPELLMSHLFGYTKGSFTGANEDKDGLIQEANGGMLFLDEVHRLPPEGQEMIFYFMDHGTYSRLGETAKTHHADVRLVCATTENPESSLLATFVRRIPILIQLPTFNTRPANERLSLLRALFSLEANRIHKQIRLSEDVVKALLGSVTYGNVGQLKSNIQLVCAKGFLKNMQSQDEIVITSEDLPDNIKMGIAALASDRDELGEVTKLLEPYMTVAPEEATALVKEDAYELPYNLYEIIGSKAAILKSEGLDQEHINNFITTDINIHLKSFYKKSDLDAPEDDKLADIVDNDIINFTKQVQLKVQDMLGYTFKQNFVYAVSLHISSFVKRVQSGKVIRSISDDLKEMVADYPQELDAAGLIKKDLEDHYQVPISQSEVYYITILLASLKSDQVAGKVGVVVAAHGSSTASSMVEVVAKLLSPDNIAAYDMPVEMSPKVAYGGIVKKVRQVDQGNGVLLLVDMGSLSTFSQQLFDETGIEVKTVDMVTTAMILEAVRKTEMIDNDLAAIYQELKEFGGYSKVNAETLPNAEMFTQHSKEPLANLPKGIIAICSTGEGTAVKIKQMLDKKLAQRLDDDITVIPISVVNMNQTIFNLSQKYQIIATTGIVKPNLNVPYISLEKLLQGDGEDFFDQVIDGLDTKDIQKSSPSLTKELCEEYMRDYFMYINPHKLIDVLWSYTDTVSGELAVSFTNTFRIGLILHVAGAIERALLRDPISVDDHELATVTKSPYYHSIQTANQLLQSKLQLSLNDAETYYIEQLFDTQTEKYAS